MADSWTPDQGFYEAAAMYVARAVQWAEAVQLYAASATDYTTAMRDLADYLEENSDVPEPYRAEIPRLRGNADLLERATSDERNELLAAQALIESFRNLGEAE